ncbi:unnamed protein product [Schistocephalus solidus]|uniref:Transmembrane protein n=1 Tax=Schistocephalus solidus TaxID=70667 RepID=A0A183TAQ6_SCHSO|nr:unnamed protein product [Schistocephalus solidus]
MNFLLHHSQKFAALGFTATAALAWALQPYADVFTRWSQMRVSNNNRELAPTQRVCHLCDLVCTRLSVPSHLRQQLDIFFTDSAESVALGDLNGDPKGYAFVGLPYFSRYATESEIPLNNLEFATPLFPHAAFSELGKERISLMFIPEDVLEFLLAREIVTLLGSAHLSKLTNTTVTSAWSFPAPRTMSRIASLSLVSAVYLAYQVAYVLNRLLGLRTLWSPPIRLLAYMGILGLMLLCQRQLLVAWRHQVCFNVDRAVGSLGDDMCAKGIAYYSWKLRWNAFWTHRLAECHRALDTFQRVTRGVQELELPLLLKQHLQMADFAVEKSHPDYYYLPPALAVSCYGARCALRFDSCTLDSRSCRLPTYNANTPTGEERFASDGQSLQPSLSGILAFGAMPSAPLAHLLQLICAPATSAQRRAALERQIISGE